MFRTDNVARQVFKFDNWNKLTKGNPGTGNGGKKNHSNHEKDNTEKFSWQELPDKLNDLWKSAKADASYEALATTERWLTHLCVMMAPESGLPKELIQQFLPEKQRESEGCSVAALWEKNAQHIARMRAISIRKFIDDNTKTPFEGLQGMVRITGDKAVFGDDNHPFNKYAIANKWNPRFPHSPPSHEKETPGKEAPGKETPTP